MTCEHNPCDIQAPWPDCIPDVSYDKCLTVGFTSNLIIQFNWMLDILLPRLKTSETIEKCNFVYLRGNGRATVNPLLSIDGTGFCPIGVAVTDASNGCVRVSTNGIACVNVIPPANGFRLGDYVYFDSNTNQFTATPQQVSNSAGKIIEIFTTPNKCGNVRVQMGIPDNTKTIGIYNETDTIIPSPNVVKTSNYTYSVRNSGWYRLTIFDLGDVTLTSNSVNRTLVTQGGTLNTATDVYITAVDNLNISASSDYQISIERIHD